MSKNQATKRNSSYSQQVNQNTSSKKAKLGIIERPANESNESSKVGSAESTAFTVALLSMMNNMSVAIPDETDLQSLRPRKYVTSAIVEFWITFLRCTIVRNPAEDVIIDANWVGNIVHNQRGASAILESLEKAVSFFRNDVHVWRGVSFKSCKRVLIPFSNGRDHWSLIVVCNLQNVKQKIDGKLLEENEPFIFQMDSIHNGKLPHNCDHTVYYFLLIRLWVLYSKEFPSETTAFRTFCEAIFFNLEKRQVAIDVITPQQNNSFDCALYLLRFVEAVLTSCTSSKSTIATQFFELRLANKDIETLRKNIRDALTEARRLIPCK